MFNDPKNLAIALVSGIIPSLIWLWFWLKEDQKRDEPAGLLAICFFTGMLAVIFVLPVQQFIKSNLESGNMQIILWATIEELFKYLALMAIIYRNRHLNEPVDWPIYAMTTALGFAALENALFLLKPISLDQTTVGLITGHLRFLGSTLLHTVSSGIVGIAMGLSYFMESYRKKIYIFLGLFVAITLHSVFNFFIMKNNGSDFLKVFVFLWVVTIIIMLLFEKLRRMSGQ
ncbi:MAG: PrsW family intramembrane metalloprotease [Candidatus Paceibacterota bacterium]|jgi:RsiW-degrading membrane proteinase PrsW (M82 family)